MSRKTTATGYRIVRDDSGWSAWVEKPQGWASMWGVGIFGVSYRAALAWIRSRRTSR